MYNNYFELSYSEFWKKQSKKYGTQNEDGLDKILEILLKENPEKVFEVGIGTGWPLAAALEENGAEVSGCDVAGSLIACAHEDYPNMNLYTGDIWGIPVEREKYDLVYCVRSSWYMKDFLNVIEKMLDMTKVGGRVVFNVINARNASNRKALVKAFFLRIIVRLYGAFMVLVCNRDYIATSPSYFYSMEEIEKVTKKYDVKYEVISTNQLLGEENFEENAQKLCFVLYKK